jgi:LysR family transcriptional regulator, glycine cleavage system transcriptional activator
MTKSYCLPPFTGLRAFEAAARYLSFSQAAEELNVTQSAVSHQIKSLEEFLGVRLFERIHNSLKLSNEGRAYLPYIRDAIEMISNATSQIRSSHDSKTLTISMLPSFATRWLIPRLPGFQTSYPHIDVRLSTSIVVVDFNKTDVDVAIRYGSGDWKGLYCKELMGEDVIPVCSPSLLQGKQMLKEPAELTQYPLLHNLSHPGEWQMWLTATGLEKIDPQRGHGFESSDLALHAAVEGMGIALGRRPLVDEALESGELIAPLPMEISSEYHYYFVCPESHLQQRNVKLFHDWLLDQIYSEIETE